MRRDRQGRSSIAGEIGTRELAMLAGGAEYVRRAQLHRPRSATALCAEAVRLHRTGLSPRDVAQALRLDPAAVVNILHAAQPAPSASNTGATP